MRPRTGPQIDNPPVGGSKSLELSNIIPFVAEPVDDHSIEDMRNNLDRQLKRISEVTFSFKNKLEDPSGGSSGDIADLKKEITALSSKVTSLEERVKVLEAGGGGVPPLWESGDGGVIRPTPGHTTVTAGNFISSGNIIISGNTQLNGNTMVNGSLTVNGSSIIGKQLIIDDGHCHVSMKTGEGLRVKVTEDCHVEIDGTMKLTGDAPIEDLKTYLETSRTEIDDHEVRIKTLEGK